MYVDAAYCYSPSSVVYLSVTIVSPATMAEPIEMLFELKTRVGPRNHVSVVVVVVVVVVEMNII